MADFEFEDPAIDNERIDDDDNDDNTPLIDPDNLSGGLPSVQTYTPGTIHQELLNAAVADYYNALAEQGATPSLGRDQTKFELVEGRLRLKAYPHVDIVNARTRKPLSLSTISGRSGGAAVRDELGFVDWTRSRLPAQAAAALSSVDQELGDAAAAVDTVELRDLGQTAKEASDAVNRMETTFGADDPPFNLRELRGLDRALQTIRGELTNNLAKLTELDDHIAMEKRKAGEAEGVDKRRIAERLRSLQDERAARIEAASASREALRSQISRMRETISRVLHEDTTLGERVRTLFREQGITIVSILTAVGMAISTLVFALTGGGGGAPASAAPSDGLKGWVKKHLQSLGRLLARLAGNAAAALPGIIGSIVSWLLSFLAKTAGWLAGNLWAVVLALGGLLLVAAREWVSSKPNQS